MLRDCFRKSLQRRRPSGEHDVIDPIVRGARKEKLQCPPDFLRQVFHERPKDG